MHRKAPIKRPASQEWLLTQWANGLDYKTRWNTGHHRFLAWYAFYTGGLGLGAPCVTMRDTVNALGLFDLDRQHYAGWRSLQQLLLDGRIS